MPRLLLILSLILASSVAANASVVYEFSAIDVGSFALTLPSPITADMTVAPGSELSCSPICADISFFVDAIAAGLNGTASQALMWNRGSDQRYYYFTPGSFTTDGVHSGLSGGTLEVTTTADAATPEPATFGLLLTPLAAVFAFRRRR
jgi:hypothetical protein